jgi:hypothetical protein
MRHTRCPGSIPGVCAIYPHSSIGKSNRFLICRLRVRVPLGILGDSFNGKTSDSDSENNGSIPLSPVMHLSDGQKLVSKTGNEGSSPSGCAPPWRKG